MNRQTRIALPLLLGAATAAAARAEPPAPPLTVRSAVARALARAPELAAARAGAGASQAAAREASAPFSPELWLTATPGYSSGIPVAVAGRIPALAGIELRETLFSPEARSESGQARAKELEAIGAREAARAGIVESVIALYGRCWEGETRVAAARREHEAREALALAARASAGEGRLLKIDLERLELESARALQKLQSAESDLDLELWELRRRVGWPGGSPVALAEDPLLLLPENAPGDDLAAAADRDPESRALAGEAEEYRRARKSLSPVWSPVVEAEAQYSRLSRANHYDEFYKTFKADDWSVAVSIAVPLWSKGRGARQDRIQEQAEEARARRLDREWKLDRALREARAALERASSGRALALRQESLEREGLDQARLLAGEGRGEPGAPEKQAIALAQAEEERAGADLDLLQAKLRLLALRGELVDRFAGTEAAAPAR